MAGYDVDEFLHHLESDRNATTDDSAAAAAAALTAAVPSQNFEALAQRSTQTSVSFVVSDASLQSAPDRRTANCEIDSQQRPAKHLKTGKDQAAESTLAEQQRANDVPSNRATTQSRSQAQSFRDFLEQEEQRNVVRLSRETGGNATPIGITAFEVLDVDHWWEHAKEWFEDVPDTWTQSAFFMALRRQGLRPFNRSPQPAFKGHDYGLKRTDVQRHGYEFDPETYAKYNRTTAQRQQARGMGGPGGP